MNWPMSGSFDRRTVTRHLTRLGLGRRKFIDPGGDSNRKPRTITAHWPGHMVHLDVKKVGLTKPYTPRHNGKVERHQRILAEELLYAREYTSEDARSAAIAVWNIHYNYHRRTAALAGDLRHLDFGPASPTSSPHTASRRRWRRS